MKTFSLHRLGAPVVASVLYAGAVVPAFAAGWSCTNEDLPQVSCGDAGCQAESGLTPFSVSLSAGGVLGACLFSGCYEAATTDRSAAGPCMVFIAPAAVWSGTSAQSAAVALTIDTGTGFAALQMAGYVTPLRCVQGEQGG